jgi:hypothetical protein
MKHLSTRLLNLAKLSSIASTGESQPPGIQNMEINQSDSTFANPSLPDMKNEFYPSHFALFAFLAQASLQYFFLLSNVV